MDERRRPGLTDFAHGVQARRLSLAARGRRSRIPRSPHRILGLRHGELDPVQIILAAQVRLRRWRRLVPGDAGLRVGSAGGVPPTGQVQRIIRARDNLLSVANLRAMAETDPRQG